MGRDILLIINTYNKHLIAIMYFINIALSLPGDRAVATEGRSPQSFTGDTATYQERSKTTLRSTALTTLDPIRFILRMYKTCYSDLHIA